MSTHNSSGNPVIFWINVAVPPAFKSKRANNGFTPGVGHSTISKTPSLSSSKSNKSGVPSPSESKHALCALLMAIL